eukprot:scaffold579088_cov47-Prasinocladus_malaysianus.AAC.2
MAVIGGAKRETPIGRDIHARVVGAKERKAEANLDLIGHVVCDPRQREHPIASLGIDHKVG